MIERVSELQGSKEGAVGQHTRGSSGHGPHHRQEYRPYRPDRAGMVAEICDDAVDIRSPRYLEIAKL